MWSKTAPRLPPDWRMRRFVSLLRLLLIPDFILSIFLLLAQKQSIRCIKLKLFFPACVHFLLGQIHFIHCLWFVFDPSFQTSKLNIEGPNKILVEFDMHVAVHIGSDRYQWFSIIKEDLTFRTTSPLNTGKIISK